MISAMNQKSIDSPQVKGHSHSNADPSASPSIHKQQPPPVAKKPTENSIKGMQSFTNSAIIW